MCYFVCQNRLLFVTQFRGNVNIMMKGKQKGLLVSNRQNMRDFIVPMSLLSAAKRHLFGEYLAHFEQSLFFATNTSIPCQNACQ